MATTTSGPGPLDPYSFRESGRQMVKDAKDNDTEFREAAVAAGKFTEMPTVRRRVAGLNDPHRG